MIDPVVPLALEVEVAAKAAVAVSWEQQCLIMGLSGEERSDNWRGELRERGSIEMTLVSRRCGWLHECCAAPPDDYDGKHAYASLSH